MQIPLPKARFLCSDLDPEWLTHRCNHVTGSEMALVLGEAPKWFSTTREQLVAEKRSGVPNPFPPTRRMVWGKEAEYGNALIVEKALGTDVRPFNGFYESMEYPRIGTTIDGVMDITAESTGAPLLYQLCSDQKHAAEFEAALKEHESSRGLLEMKQSDGWKSQVEEWTKGVPHYYWIQVQTQLYVSGLPWAVIACRLGVADIRLHFVEPDDFWIRGRMVPAVERFWKEVDSGK